MRAGCGALAALALALTGFSLPSLGQAGPVVQVDFSNPGLSPSHWTLIIHPDGSAHFHSERGNAPSATPQNSDSIRLVVPDQDRDLRLSAQFARHVFEAARNDKWFNVKCESHRKVAFQGWKRLSYSGPEGQGSCEFNYSNDEEIEALGDSMVSVANTILEGARLEMLLQHDRLGLDQEIEYIVEAQGEGRVQQICAIRGILARLADDPGVMERVRKRARLLLEKKEE
ncbi:MAG: hypothetical protein ABR905_01565 [Terracidiphilus sp.]|jgi:hypothetical protein